MTAKKPKSYEAVVRKISLVNHSIAVIFSTSSHASLQIGFETFKCNANQLLLSRKVLGLQPKYEKKFVQKLIRTLSIPQGNLSI